MTTILNYFSNVFAYLSLLYRKSHEDSIHVYLIYHYIHSAREQYGT